MVEKLTVIFFILLCLLLGFYLILSPWDTVFGSWGENHLLVFLADKSGLPVLQRTVSSNWVRGAVTGLGLVNIFIAVWEAFNFQKSVAMLQGQHHAGRRDR
jgi:hypothetical protein